MKKLPKTIAVTIERDGDTSYFLADKTPSDLAELGEVRTVGLYELKQVMKVESVAKITVK